MASDRISQLAERSGVPATTLRFYEDAGLLPADRTPSGYRVYGEDAVERLAFISSAKLLGLALNEIRECWTSVRKGVRVCPDAAAAVGCRPDLGHRRPDRLAARVLRPPRRCSCPAVGPGARRGVRSRLRMHHDQYSGGRARADHAVSDLPGPGCRAVAGHTGSLHAGRR
ncbi:MerR family transcriptional regulator [Streptomyces europaeiscabiei]|uniref:MerR family transcriptional regulator n=1 Tax=Streptomyces europaeiscabiei TaxID=146819 RepID=UPI0038F7EBA4